MRCFVLLLSAIVVCGCRVHQGVPWPQFRGPNASGVAKDGRPLPADIGPDRHVLWKTPLPQGHSSPVLDRDRLYLTAVRDETLLTLAVDRETGEVLWEREAPAERLEQIHTIGSHAQSSPATDGERVVSFFGSCGLVCYSRDGEPQWFKAMGPFSNTFGAGSSPIMEGDRVILNQDHDEDSFLMAIDKYTGDTVWKTDRSEFPRGYATPVIWETPEGKQIVVVGTLRVVGYDFESGQEIWTVHGLARIIGMTPVVGDDGNLYVAAWTMGGGETERIDPEPFPAVVKEIDANGNGLLEREEVSEGPLRERFDQIDRDKNGQITRTEYDDMRRIFRSARNAVLAIRPGGRGDITETHVLWRHRKEIPYIPSPLYYGGSLFMVKNGGIVSSLDAKTGKPIRQARVSGRGSYYSSPVAGDGKIYLLSQRGELAVISAEPEWRELASAKFGEDSYATPAIVEGRIYLRTRGHLYCFGLREKG